MFGGIVGGIFGVMLSFKIYENEEPEEQEEYPDEEELQIGRASCRERV